VAKEAEATVEGLAEKKHTTTEELLEVVFCAWNCSQWLAVEIVSLQAVSISQSWTELTRWQTMAGVVRDGRRSGRTEAAEHRNCGIYVIGSCYQATTGEDTAG
jgi:hypothetical protein